MQGEGVESYVVHHPKVEFDEEMLAPAVALFAESATKYG